MAKFYSKSDLTFKSGYVVSATGDVVALPKGVANQLNAIEEMVQKAAWLEAQPAETKAPDLGEFVRKSAFDSAPTITVDTPTLDAKIKESMRLDADIKRQLCADKLNEIIGTYKEAFAFCSEEDFVEGTDVTRLDLPTLGDPLKLTANDLAAIIGSMVFEDEPEVIKED